MSGAFQTCRTAPMKSSMNRCYLTGEAIHSDILSVRLIRWQKTDFHKLKGSVVLFCFALNKMMLLNILIFI
jgi:hypothetical protein